MKNIFRNQYLQVAISILIAIVISKLGQYFQVTLFGKYNEYIGGFGIISVILLIYNLVLLGTYDFLKSKQNLSEEQLIDCDNLTRKAKLWLFFLISIIIPVYYNFPF